nr:1927_t:CDS:2 [Entrophospora candida]
MPNVLSTGYAKENAKKEKIQQKLTEERKLKWRHWSLSTLPDEPSESDKNVARLSFGLANKFEYHVDKDKTIKNEKDLWPSANLIVESLAIDKVVNQCCNILGFL